MPISIPEHPSAPAVPERIILPGVKKASGKKHVGRGSPVQTDNSETSDAGVPTFDAVYINLTKRVDRKKLFQQEMKAQGLKARRFPAKTGDEVKDNQVARTWHSRLNCLYDKKTVPAEHVMSKGERGCSGSHLALWKQCAKRDDPSTPMLILEDDATLWDRSGVYFPELVQRLIAATEQLYDVENEPVMLYVGCEVRRSPLPKPHTQEPYPLVPPPTGLVVIPLHPAPRPHLLLYALL